MKGVGPSGESIEVAALIDGRAIDEANRRRGSAVGALVGSQPLPPALVAGADALRRGRFQEALALLEPLLPGASVEPAAEARLLLELSRACEWLDLPREALQHALSAAWRGAEAGDPVLAALGEMRVVVAAAPFVGWRSWPVLDRQAERALEFLRRSGSPADFAWAMLDAAAVGIDEFDDVDDLDEAPSGGLLRSACGVFDRIAERRGAALARFQIAFVEPEEDRGGLLERAAEELRELGLELPAAVAASKAGLERARAATLEELQAVSDDVRSRAAMVGELGAAWSAAFVAATLAAYEYQNATGGHSAEALAGLCLRAAALAAGAGYRGNAVDWLADLVDVLVAEDDDEAAEAAAEVVEQALALAGELADEQFDRCPFPTSAVRLRLLAVQMAIHAGEALLALEHLDIAQRLLAVAPLDFPPELAWGSYHHFRGLAYQALGMPTLSAEEYGEAKDCFERIGDRSGALTMAAWQAAELAKADDADGAWRLLRPLVEAYESGGWDVPDEIAEMIADWVARGCAAVGKYGIALSIFERCRQVQADAGDDLAEGRTLLAMADAAEQDGRIDAARGFLTRAVEKGRHTGGDAGLALTGEAHLAMAALWGAVGNAERRGDSLAEALDSFTRSGATDWVRASLALMSNWEYDHGDPERALVLRYEELELLTEVADREQRAESLVGLAFCLARVDRRDDALEALAEARAIFAEVGHEEAVGDCDDIREDLESGEL